MGSIETTNTTTIVGTSQIPGHATGEVISSNTEISFWGGIDSNSGDVIDRHHPLHGQCIDDKVLAIPGGRGSCTGSAVILQLLMSGRGPKALLFARREDILTLGVLIAKEVFGVSVPVVVLDADDFKAVLSAKYASIIGDSVTLSCLSLALPPQPVDSKVSSPPVFASSVGLSLFDHECLHGKHGKAAQIAMRITLQIATLQGTTKLIDVSQVHIDGCVYTGQASLSFAQKLRDWCVSDGTGVRVPTSMNSISVDQRRWKQQGVDYTFGSAAEALANAYTYMGANPTFTCAPYMLDSKPKQGEQVAWGESNAVVYANSVLGARTMKYPDFLDICIALTGVEGRRAQITVKVLHNTQFQANAPGEAFWPLLGYCVGEVSGHRIPVVVGSTALDPTTDDLKAFGAAFVTVASAPMFHMVGVTPEAPSPAAVEAMEDVVPEEVISYADLLECRGELNTAPASERVDLVSLGNPHFSLTEMVKLAKLVHGRSKSSAITIVVTTSRFVYEQAVSAPHSPGQLTLLAQLEAFGIQVVIDTCWCMITEPIIHCDAKVIMTNSAKYAHYGPGLTGRKMRFGSLRECVEVACGGW